MWGQSTPSQQDPRPRSSIVARSPGRAGLSPAVHSTRGAGAACAWTEAENQSTFVCPCPVAESQGRRHDPGEEGSAGVGWGGVPSPPGRGRNSALLLPLPQVDADKVAPALLLTHPQERQPPAQGKSTRHPLPPCQPPPRAGSAPPGCSAPTNPPATPAHRAGLGPTGSPVPLMGGPVAKAGRGQLPYLSMSPPSLSLK